MRTHSSVVLPVTKRSCRMGWIEADEGAYGSVKLCVCGPLRRAGMNETVFPEVTTSRFVCGESSIEVIGLGKVKLVVNVRVRRSHHLERKGSEGDGIKRAGTRT